MQSGQIEGLEVKWTDRETIIAYNSTDSTILPDSRVFLEFNYQLGQHGEWCIVFADLNGGDFVGITIQSIPAGTPPVCSASGAITDFGSPATTTGVNVLLIQIDAVGDWEACTDVNGNQIKIRAWNACPVKIEQCEIVFGALIKGNWMIEQVCCPAA